MAESANRHGVVLGLGVAFMALGGVCLAIGLYEIHQAHVARQGWKLVPLVVVADAVPAGSRLTYDMLSQRAVPEQFYTASLVKVDGVNQVIGKRLLVPLQPGDLVRWDQFGGAVSPDVCPWLQEDWDNGAFRKKIDGLIASHGAPPE